VDVRVGYLVPISSKDSALDLDAFLLVGFYGDCWLHVGSLARWWLRLPRNKTLIVEPHIYLALEMLELFGLPLLFLVLVLYDPQLDLR
jgi:hypothetical protein